jgi:hypothetical protein
MSLSKRFLLGMKSPKGITRHHIEMQLSRLALLNEKTKNLGSAPEGRSPGF